MAAVSVKFRQGSMMVLSWLMFPAILWRCDASPIPTSAVLVDDMHKTKELCVYTITTMTGNKWQAGTDSTISVRLLNKDGDQVFFPSLDNAKNNFERGHVDTFQETGDCVANICKMILYTDNSGIFPGWFVDWVGYAVETAATGKQQRTWQLHEWLPKDDSTGAFFDIRDNCF